MHILVEHKAIEKGKLLFPSQDVAARGCKQNFCFEVGDHKAVYIEGKIFSRFVYINDLERRDVTVRRPADGHRTSHWQCI